MFVCMKSILGMIFTLKKKWNHGTLLLGPVRSHPVILEHSEEKFGETQLLLFLPCHRGTHLVQGSK